ncbi:MAG: TonB-dependent receptor, partial [Myxococcota bacterium]
KDSITADGDDLELAPEFSWNYEVGFRFRHKNWFFTEWAGFVMDFQNQVVPPSESSGAVAIEPGDLGRSVINAGQTLHAGLEGSVTVDVPAVFQSDLRIPLTVAYTWVPVAQFVGGRYDGNRLPYAPQHILTTTLRIFHRVGFTASITGRFVTEQLADKAGTITPSINGLVGAIDARFLLNARIGYTWKRGRYSLGAFVSGKNLTNARFIVSRRPQGIRPGLPLHVFGGIHGTL